MSKEMKQVPFYTKEKKIMIDTIYRLKVIINNNELKEIKHNTKYDPSVVCADT